MTNVAVQTAAPNTTGLVLHKAFGYDLLVWLLSLGREGTYRQKTLELAGLKLGESVLDVGCGTGSLAIAAKRHVGPAGKVYATFDAVFSTTMLHHLPDKARRQCLSEIRRVLGAGGRLLAVDFGGPVTERRSWVARFHHHGRIDLRGLIPLVSEAGLKVIQGAPMAQSFGLMSDLHFILAAAPGA